MGKTKRKEKTRPKWNTNSPQPSIKADKIYKRSKEKKKWLEELDANEQTYSNW